MTLLLACSNVIAAQYARPARRGRAVEEPRVSIFDLDAFRDVPLDHDPFKFRTVARFFKAEGVQGARDDYSVIARADDSRHGHRPYEDECR